LLKKEKIKKLSNSFLQYIRNHTEINFLLIYNIHDMNMLKNKWILLLTGFFIFFSLIIISRCNNVPEPHSEWRYEIHGYVKHKDKQHKAIWYTDTIEIGENYLRYENSDGTEVVIPPPFVLIDHKYEKSIEKYNNHTFD